MTGKQNSEAIVNMKVAPISGLIACVMLLGSTVYAGTTSVSQTLDYTDNCNEYLSPETNPDRIVFVHPWATLDNSDPYNPYVIDHPPWYRGSLEDWGWMHDLMTRVPADANGIESATLVIEAWDVNPDPNLDNGINEGEIDEVKANGALLGTLDVTPIYDWGTTTFTLTRPDFNDVLDELWQDRQVYIFFNIDKSVVWGHRVTLGSSTLTVNYTVTGEGRGSVQPIFRFWSPVLAHHFYTTDESERDGVIENYPGTWDYEGPAYYAPVQTEDPNARPIYRFWSDLHSSHFYTISDTEKEHILATYPTNVWQLEGVVFYAYPEGLQPADAMPVYRFWSDQHGTHFYTISENEKDYLIATYPSFTWAYEGVAWYAYE